jgi:hypothetical protein
MPLNFRFSSSLCSPSFSTRKVRKKPSGGRCFVVTEAIWARKMFCPSSVFQRWPRSSSASSWSPERQRKSKKISDRRTASGFGAVIQVAKYFFHVLSGWHHRGLLAM